MLEANRRGIRLREKTAMPVLECFWRQFVGRNHTIAPPPKIREASGPFLKIEALSLASLIVHFGARIRCHNVYAGSVNFQFQREVDRISNSLFCFMRVSDDKRPATLFFGSKMSYNELDAAASRFAAALTSLGINHGDRIALCLPNCPQYLIAYFGVLRAGGTVVQINPVLSERELAFELADAAAETIVALDLLVERVATVWEETPLKRLIRTSPGSYVPFTIRLALKVKSRGKVKPPPASAEVLEMETLLIQDVEATEISINPANDVAVLQYTGGTTGNPKAAMLTHSNLMANSHQVRAWLNGITVGEEVMLAALPLFHVYGMTICMNLALLIGATIVLLPRMDLPEISLEPEVPDVAEENIE